MSLAVGTAIFLALDDFACEVPQNTFVFCALGPPGHHCLQPPHSVENYTVYVFNLHLVAFSRPSPLSFPCSWPGHCVFHAPASFDAGKSLPRWRLALAQEAERKYPLRQFCAWHLCISLSPVNSSFSSFTTFSCEIRQVDVERN